MQIDPRLCFPDECDMECLEACMSVHGNDSPLTYTPGNKVPRIDLDSCTQCMKCVRNCTRNAISPFNREKRERKESTQSKSMHEKKVTIDKALEELERLSSEYEELKADFEKKLRDLDEEEDDPPKEKALIE